MTEDYRTYVCDICGSGSHSTIDVTASYLGGYPLCVCHDCGFVYVRQRRTSKTIAEIWSKVIYENDYIPKIPAVVARHTYVAEFLSSQLKRKGGNILDMGAGDGQFLNIVRRMDSSIQPFGIEPSAKNCQEMAKIGIDSYCGTVESYIEDRKNTLHKFQVVSLLWTLENSHSCTALIAAARAALTDGGYLIVATGSRILVPFKKPLYDYLGLYDGTFTPDLHSFRFSANSLQNLLESKGFDIASINSYIDTDHLVIIARNTGRSGLNRVRTDDPDKIIDYFERWHRDTEQYFSKSSLLESK